LEAFAEIVGPFAGRVGDLFGLSFVHESYGTD
jgi:hypothetical protein